MSAHMTAPQPVDDADLADLRELARSIFEKPAAEALLVPQVAIPFDPSLWNTLAKSGLTLLSAPEAAGGSGAGLTEAVALLSVSGEYAAPVPLAENDLLAGWLLVEAGLALPAGPLTSAAGQVVMTDAGPGHVSLSGTLSAVPWARDAAAVAVVGRAAAGDVVFVVPTELAAVARGHNLAHEPRDEIRFDVRLPRDAVGPVPAAVWSEWHLRGALARAAQTCGALESALRLTLDHAATRVQFGRPLGRFQAVQHLVAEAAGEITMARAACDLATRTAVGCGIESPAGELAVAVAKSQAARAAGVVNRTAHQVHGAIGFTLDHQLRHFTLRMQAWRGEFGDERHWERRVGEITLAAGAPDVWPLLTSGRPGPQ
jgi:acyl-CoA dehydrogenase